MEREELVLKLKEFALDIVLLNEAAEALAQPAQEPVAWRYRGNLHEFDPSDWATGPVTPLYTAPPQRPWVGLTDEELNQFHNWKDCTWSTNELVRHVEATLKSKNT